MNEKLNSLVEFLKKHWLITILVAIVVVAFTVQSISRDNSAEGLFGNGDSKERTEEIENNEDNEDSNDEASKEKEAEERAEAERLKAERQRELEAREEEARREESEGSDIKSKERDINDDSLERYDTPKDSSAKFPKADKFKKEDFEKMAIKLTEAQTAVATKDNYESLYKDLQAVASKEMVDAIYPNGEPRDFEDGTRTVEIQDPEFEITKGKPGDDTVRGVLKYRYMSYSEDYETYTNMDMATSVVFKKIDGEYRVADLVM